MPVKEREFQRNLPPEEWAEEISPANVGNRLPAIRAKSDDMSRKAFAELLGLSETTIVRAEHDSRVSSELFSLLRAVAIIGQHATWSKLVVPTPGELSGRIGGLPYRSSTPLSISAVAIVNGLAAIRGQAMLAGSALVAEIPLEVGLAEDFSFVSALQRICSANELACQRVSGKFEIRTLRNRPGSASTPAPTAELPPTDGDRSVTTTSTNVKASRNLLQIRPTPRLLNRLHELEDLHRMLDEQLGHLKNLGEEPSEVAVRIQELLEELKYCERWLVRDAQYAPEFTRGKNLGNSASGRRDTDVAPDELITGESTEE